MSCPDLQTVKIHVRHCSARRIRYKQETHPQSAVPRARAERHAVRRHAEAADTVFVTGQDTHALALERVPDVARPVVVTAEQDATRDGKGDGRDAAQDVVMRVDVQLAVSADVEQAAGGIVRARCKGIAIREEAIHVNSRSVKNARKVAPRNCDSRDGVDVGLVANKGLNGLAAADIPKLGGGVASARDK